VSHRFDVPGLTALEMFLKSINGILKKITRDEKQEN